VFSYEFRGQFQNLTAGLTTASRNVQELSGKLTALDKDGAKMRAGLTQIGGTAGRVGLVAAAGLGAVITTAAKFDKAMSAVSAVTGESAENMDKLRAAAIKAGADTAFSASEAAAGIENLAKAGVSTADILGGGLSGALDLAAAGGIEVSEAAEAASKAMTQFGLAGSDVPHIADLLAAAAGKATGDVSDFTQALNQSGLVADQVGLSIEETTGGLAAFASAGLLGSDAGTSFKTMLAALTPNSNKAAQTMEALGLNAYDAQGQFVGLAEFAGQLQTALGNMSAEQRQAALETIFGSDAVRAASVLYEQGEDGIRGWTSAVNDSGYAAEVAGERLDNLAGDWEAFKGSLETALIGAGEGSQGILRELVQGATKATNAFNDLPPAAQNATTGLLAITAITGGTAWFGAKVINGIADTKQALNDLGLTADRTSGNLGTVARVAGRLAIVGTIGAGIGSAIAEFTNANLELENLSRNLESISKGVETQALGQIVDDLRIVSDRSISDGLGEAAVEVFSLNGAFGTFSTTLDAAQDDLKAVDQNLAAMVESGNAEQAAVIFEAIVAQLNGLPAGASVSEQAIDDVMGKFDGYGTALKNASAAAEGSTAATTGAGNAVKGMGGKMAQSAEQITAAEKALEDARKAAREGAESFVNLGKSLDDGKVSLRQWLAQLEQQATALRDFRVNAQTAAKKGLDEGLIASLQEAGAAGALRMRQLANATDEEIARANKAWQGGQRQIKLYTDAVGGVPKQAKTVVKTETGNALRTIQDVVNSLNVLDGKTATTYVVTRRLGSATPRQADEYATGGYTGAGGKYEPAGIVHRGEVVIPQEYVKRDWSMLKARYGNLPGFAEGGKVGGPRIGPNNPLYGIGRDDISAVELAGRIVNLTAAQMRQLSRDMDFLSKSSLAKLGKALEKAAAITEREVEASKERLEAARAERSSIMDSVRSRLISDDLFASSIELRVGDLRPDGGFASAEQARAFTSAAFGQASFLAGPQQSANDRLRADIERARQEAALIRSLRGRGVKGDALRYLIESGNLSGASAMSSADLRQFENLYNRRERVVSEAGGAAADALGITRELRAAREDYREGTAELKDVNRRLARLEKLQEKAPKETGREVGAAVRGEAVKGAQQRR
jgi:TP901 family phage tail tape measure protein